MIAGNFDTYGRPLLECRVIIPRLQVDGRTPFLLDTGADSTCLHQIDAERLRIPFDQLSNRSYTRGVGEGLRTFGSRPFSPLATGLFQEFMQSTCSSQSQTKAMWDFRLSLDETSSTIGTCSMTLPMLCSDAPCAMPTTLSHQREPVSRLPAGCGL